MELVLAIEAAVAGGSLALLRDTAVVDKWHSDAAVSRAELLLPRISEILEKNKVEKKDLAQIAVSNGPGSYTGIRIGLATAMGLAKSLNIPCIGISLLDAIHRTFPGTDETVAVVPIGRDGFCWRSSGDVRTSDSGDRRTASGKLIDFLNDTASLDNPIVLAHRNVHASIGSVEGPQNSIQLLDIGCDMAAICGLASGSFDDGLEPFYAADNLDKTGGSVG